MKPVRRRNRPGIKAEEVTSCEERLCLQNDFSFALILPPGLHHEGDYRGASERADRARFPPSAQTQASREASVFIHDYFLLSFLALVYIVRPSGLSPVRVE